MASEPQADANPVLRLQRTIGNQAVLRRLERPLIQRQASETFGSSGYGVKDKPDATTETTITRPKQVLSEYGLTCYGTSVMYMLQSYGLVPPNMSREEFEHAFTPLNPYGRSSSPPAAKSGVIKVNGKEQTGAVPIDLITAALEGTRTTKKVTSIGSSMTATEATLRGADWGGFTVADIMRHMPAILDKFQKQSEKPEYKFMKTALPASGTGYTAAAKEKWTDVSDELIAGTIGASYFKGGNTMMVGVDYNFPPSGSILHWAVIVREKEATVEIGGKSYHLYPADDPHYKSVYVMAPLLKSASADALKAVGLSKESGFLMYNGRQVHMMVKGSAYRRSGVK